ncbi:hypothetical protein [Cellulomonas marina]|uniref:hypothetical protein n=1 Tax=Cellulomonas marina TaxID=988821 RepID=UPI0019417EBC|nr:hypothetical protein [Cellulomonas marina]GIG28284.1 hypothetical protein Cma02nite_08840 [Cellulomonas marina]
MSRAITFFLLCEGTSDEALVGHIETLVVRQGVAEVIGISRSGGGSVQDKVQALVDEGATFDFVAVHRDADSRDGSTRRAEVHRALESVGVAGCPVVPVQMTEAWFIVDERAIRAAVGRPSGREALDLPPLRSVETTHDPKAVLRNALIAASGTTGRRRKRAEQEWSNRRRILLERLDVDGPVQQLPSWQRLVSDIERVVAEIRQPGSP